MKKDEAKIDEWLREVAPSKELRKWFGHDPANWDEFKERYWKLLASWGEATQVYLNYSAIEIHQAQADNESGWVKVVDKSAWINLTATLNVNRTICYANLQAGAYNLICFRVLDAHITVDGVNYTASVLK